MAQITGSEFADVLVGTPTSDVFLGGVGHDTFVFTGRGAAQSDVIIDFGATYFGGPISGAQEVPAVTSAASGTFTAWLNRNQTEFNFNATVVGLDLGNLTPSTTDNVTASHFHAAAAGVSGGVVFGYIGAPNNETGGETVVNAAAGTVSGSWDAAEGNNTTLTAQLANLLGGRIYINFHTPVAPGGEIRGQANLLDSGADRIDVSALGFTDYAGLQAIMTEQGGSTMLSVTYNGQVQTLTLLGVPMARLGASDFIFATTPGNGAVGSEGADELNGGGGSDSLFGAGGNDRINAGQGNDFVDGGDGADTILGLDGNDSVHGQVGDDDVNGNLGDDYAWGEDGADSVRGGQGNDTIDGGAGDDPHVNGNLGNDLVRGGDGNDTVYGGRDADTLYGDGGNDLLSGDLGADVLFGGAGADRFVLRAGSGVDWVGDFNPAEGDRILVATGTNFTIGAASGQALISLPSGDAIGLVGFASTAFNASMIVFV